MFPSRALAEQQICQMDDGTFERKFLTNFLRFQKFLRKKKNLQWFYSDFQFRRQRERREAFRVLSAADSDAIFNWALAQPPVLAFDGFTALKFFVLFCVDYFDKSFAAVSFDTKESLREVP